MLNRKPKTRNSNTQTEAAFFGSLRGHLRRAYRYWKPMQQCKTNARIEYHGDNKRRKWAYLCNHCKQYYKGSEVQIDHRVPVGTLLSLEHLPAFVAALTNEDVNAYQLLCKPCHLKKTNSERVEKK